MIDGLGGASGGKGVEIQQPVLTSNGAITIYGDANVGMGIAVQGSSATIIANGTNGSVLITALSGTTGDTRGMDLWNNSRVNTSDGPITLIGTSRSNSDTAVWLEVNANVTAGNSGAVTVTGYNGWQTVKIDGKLATGGGPVSINGDKLYIGNSANISSTLAGNVTIQPTTPNKSIFIGDNDSSTNLGLSQEELNTIAAKLITIGNITSGTIVNTAAISRSNATLGTNLTLISGNSITQTGAGNLTISGIANFVSSGLGTAGNITLNNTTNNFGTVTANGANISIYDVDSVNIGNIQSTGNFTVTTTGGTTTLGANITTAGDQQFNTPVMLANNVTLRTTANGNATFASTLNGAYTLTANLGLGSLINQGAVGSSTTINLVSGSISGIDLNLTIAPGAVIGSITGSGSNNTITVQSLANETSNIVISGTNSGNITSSGGTSIGSFSGITRLVGGAGSDTFKFVNNSALLNGTIDGGSGTNALNYGGTTKPTFINLGTGQATGVTSTTSTGVVTNIQNVFGGTGNDYLTGSAANNVMDGGAGDDTMSGLGGNDIMVGNYGADNMNGGAGIDILIGGYVDFVVGSLQEGLESIMSTWNNVTDGTFNAVSKTLGTASSTEYRLVGDTNLASTYLLQTVFNDQATDRLTDISSSTTPNWFFATERVTQGNDVVLAGTTFTVSKKTVTSKTGRTAR